jgi:NarL family two-component system response regulator LiaR
MKVLIVDDNERMRLMIKRFIRDQVDEFIECEDGSKVLESYSQHNPDLVLMDVKMKNLDGLEATKEIKTAFPDAQVVIVSQWDSPALRLRAAEVGAKSYVTKTNLLPLRDLFEPE